MNPADVVRMARYNAWMNDKVYAAATRLDDDLRRRAAGAFWGSIHGTLSHLLWADQVWMSRLAGTPAPGGTLRASATAFDAFATLRDERARLDASIVDWSRGLDADWLGGDLRWWSGAAGRELVRPRAAILTHVFNHQTHHRGQVHCLLTQAGIDPGDTDLFLMPD